MNNDHFLSNIIDNIGNSTSLDEGTTLVPISLRLSKKNAAMLEVFSELNQGKAPLHILPSQLSQALAEKLLSSKENADLLELMLKEGAFKEDEKWRGAFHVLFMKGAITSSVDMEMPPEFYELMREDNPDKEEDNPDKELEPPF